MRLVLSTLAALCALGAATAHAVPQFTLAGGVAGTTPPGANDVVPGVAGFFNDDAAGTPVALTVSITEAARIRYTFVGKEAGFANDFTTPFGTLTNGATPGDAIAGEVGAGALDFGFTSPLGGGTTVANAEGAQLVGGQNIGFFAALESDGDVLLAFDDGGADTDDNHDDHVVRASIVAVPEPATLGLLGAGLAGIGLAARRRRT